MVLPAEISTAITGFAEALLIGLVIGAQRETANMERKAGMRDFLLIALTGGVCGLLESIWLTAAALLSITVFIAVFHWQGKERTGITTELATVAVFCLAVLAASPGKPIGSGLAVGAAIIVAAFLESKRALHKFIRETITDTEFNDTIWFLAIIFIIYPLLPEGEFGPYSAFAPRRIWLFIILVSSISYVGYFLQKFLGPHRGLAWTSVLGGLASTTASTLAFARQAMQEPEQRNRYWSVTVIANAIQFPRILVILYVMNAGLAQANLSLLLTMTAAGLLMGLLLYHRETSATDGREVSAGNPFRLLPALKFGALFAIIVFASKAATAEFGGQGLYWASTIGGLVDADAVAVSLAGLEHSKIISLITGRDILYLAMLMNAVLKTGLAFFAGGASFAWRVATGFAAMFGAGLLVWILMGGL